MNLAPNSDRTYIILLNWNGADDTLQCLRSLHQIHNEEVVFVVCDNDSKPHDFSKLMDGLIQECRRTENTFVFLNAGDHLLAPNAPVAAKSVVLIQTGANLGFAGGVNSGLSFAVRQGDLNFAWILNNDCEIAPDALANLIIRMKADPKMGICGSTLIYHGDRNRIQALGGARYQPWRGRSLSIGAFSAADTITSDHTTVEQQMDYVVGASMLVSRRFLEVVGLMDERYFLYSEEHDWAHRGRQAGFTLGWAPGSRVFHKHGASIGSSASGGSPLSMFYLYRSKALFTALHFRKRMPVVLLSLAIDAVKLAIKGHPAKTKAALRGLLSFNSPARF
ncbi:MAG: glycosyltransferase family 2 protein [Burkholderiaceae bacterium]|nr:glycosyltransferase family 2 protein [Burkholderiaceae bacterium]